MRASRHDSSTLQQSHSALRMPEAGCPRGLDCVGPDRRRGMERASPSTPAAPSPPTRRMRNFSSPNGRTWTVEVVRLPMTGAHSLPSPEREVLRFRSGPLVLDLPDVPDAWEALPDESLVELARRAQPPRLGIGGGSDASRMAPDEGGMPVP